MKTIIARVVLTPIAAVAIAAAVFIAIAAAVFMAAPLFIWRAWQWLVLHGAHNGDADKMDRDEWKSK